MSWQPPQVATTTSLPGPSGKLGGAAWLQAAETEDQKERYPVLFEINMLRCIFCGFCEEVCPEEAIIMSNEYELAFSNQKDALFGKDKLLVPIEKVQPRLDFLRAHR